MADLTMDHWQLRELLEKATPGPWYLSGDRWIRADAAPGFVIFYTTDDDGIHGNKPDDLPFIVAAVNALPMLLDQIDGLQAEVERLRGEIALAQYGT